MAHLVVAQLAVRLLLIPEVHCSNPVISEFLTEHLFTVNCIEKTKNKEKEAENGPLFNSCKRSGII